MPAWSKRVGAYWWKEIFVNEQEGTLSREKNGSENLIWETCTYISEDIYFDTSKRWKHKMTKPRLWRSQVESFGYYLCFQNFKIYTVTRKHTSNNYQKSWKSCYKMIFADRLHYTGYKTIHPHLSFNEFYITYFHYTISHFLSCCHSSWFIADVVYARWIRLVWQGDGRWGFVDIFDFCWHFTRVDSSYILRYTSDKVKKSFILRQVSWVGDIEKTCMSCYIAFAIFVPSPSRILRSFYLKNLFRASSLLTAGSDHYV